MELIRLVLPPHGERSATARIINVSSVGGMTAMPTMVHLQRLEVRAGGRFRVAVVRNAPVQTCACPLVRPGFIHSDGLPQGCASQLKVDVPWSDESDPYHAHYAKHERAHRGLDDPDFFTTPRDRSPKRSSRRSEHKNPAALDLRHPRCLRVQTACPPLAAGWPSTHRPAVRPGLPRISGAGGVEAR